MDITKRQHLEQVQRQTGIRSPELDVEEIPPQIAYLWEIFWQLNKTRAIAGGMSSYAQPLNYTDIYHYGKVMRFEITPTEAQILFDLDSVYLSHLNKSTDV